MKILVLCIILAITFRSLAHRPDERRPKGKSTYYQGWRHSHHRPSGSYPGPIRPGFPGIREKPRIPYGYEEIQHHPVDDEDHVPQVNGGHKDSPVNDEQADHHVQNEQKGRQARQSHNTHLSLQVPLLGSFLGGNQGSGTAQQVATPQFTGGSQTGNLLGHPGSVVIFRPGGSSGNLGGSSIFRPDPQGSIGQNGYLPFKPGFSAGTPSGPSTAGGAGGLNPNPDSGLAGGLGGVYGGGYGIGLGGLIFGGPNGPVFAGNAALNDGLGGNSESGTANDDLDNGDISQSERVPPFRPIPQKANFNGGTRNKENDHGTRVEDAVYPKVRYPNINGTSVTPEKNSATSKGGETIGYVAFIFPKRPKPAVPQNQVDSIDAAAPKPKVVTSAQTVPVSKAVTNQPGAPHYVPVPVHIPIDRPYPVIIPKPYPVEVLKPYPVAVPVRQPVQYEITRPLWSRPVLVGVHEGAGSAGFVLQPSIETGILRKRFDEIQHGKPV